MGRINFSGCWKKPTYQPTYEKLDGTEVILGFEEEAEEEALESFNQETNQLTDSIEAQAAVIAIIDTQVDDVATKDIGVRDPEYNVHVDEVTWDESDETKSLLAEKKFEEYVAKKWRLDKPTNEVQQVSLSKENHLQISNEGVVKAIKDFFSWLWEKITGWWNKLWDSNSNSDKKTEKDSATTKAKMEQARKDKVEKWFVKCREGKDLTDKDLKLLGCVYFGCGPREDVSSNIFSNLTMFKDRLEKFNNKESESFQTMLKNLLVEIQKDFATIDSNLENESKQEELKAKIKSLTDKIVSESSDLGCTTVRKESDETIIEFHSPTILSHLGLKVPNNVEEVAKTKPFYISTFDPTENRTLSSMKTPVILNALSKKLEEFEKEFSETNKFEQLLREVEDIADKMTNNHKKLTSAVIEPLNKIIQDIKKSTEKVEADNDLLKLLVKTTAEVMNCVNSFISFIYHHKEWSRKILIGITNFIQKRDSSNGGISPDAEYTKAQSTEDFKLRQQRFG